MLQALAEGHKPAQSAKTLVTSNFAQAILLTGSIIIYDNDGHVNDHLDAGEFAERRDRATYFFLPGRYV